MCALTHIRGKFSEFLVLGQQAIIKNKHFSQIQHLVGVRRGKEKNKAVARDRECSAEPSRCARATLTRSSRRSISGRCSKESVFSLSKKLRAHASHPSNPPCIYQTRHASEQMTNPVQVCNWQGVGVACLPRAQAWPAGLSCGWLRSFTICVCCLTGSTKSRFVLRVVAKFHDLCLLLDGIH